MRHTPLIYALFSVAFAQSASPCRAQLDWLPSIPQGDATVRLKRWGPDFDGPLGDHQTPTDLAMPTDSTGRLFVAMQLGKVRIIDAQRNLLPVFLDTANENTPDQPHFFTSIAFHKQFAVAGKPGYGKFYTIEVENADTAPADFGDSLKTRPDGFQQVIYEYTMNDANATLFEGTKREVIRFDRSGDSSGHNVGDLAFDRAGYLYIANGDGGNDPNTGDEVAISDNAQYLGNVYGKILRIDPIAPELKPTSKDPVSANGKYRVPRTNPFNESPASGVDKSVDEIYAYGMRNPYRLNVDLTNNELYVGSVGQANIEAVYRVTPGANLGWNFKEGSFIFDRFDQHNLTADVDSDGDGLLDFSASHGLTDPLFEYDHQDGVAVLGGFVYRGKQLPQLYGKYVFADFAGGKGVLQGRLLYGDLATGEVFEMQLSPESSPLPPFVYTVGQDRRGELYVAGTTADGAYGSIFRLVPPRVTVASGTRTVPESSSAVLMAIAATSAGIWWKRRR